MPIDFTKASFVKSCVQAKDFPELFIHRNTLCPEIAIVGRSNAGKSSLINHLVNNKSLVYISSNPGKTQCINFFSIDSTFFLVDLPGYGFANVGKALRKTWGTTLSHYLENRPQLHLLIIVLDSRRDLSDQDKQMIAWAENQQKKTLFIFSKQDKLSTSEKKQETERLLKSLQDLHLSTSWDYLPYSIKDSSCRISLRNHIFSSLN